MNPEHKRIVDMASGWVGSDAEITLSPSDAILLESVGATTKPGKRPGIDPATIGARDLCAAAAKLQKTFHQTPPGGEPTPNQQSVSGPAIAASPKNPAAPAADESGGDDELEALTVAELRDLAADRKVEVHAGAKKADLVEALRAAAKKK